MKDIVKRAAAIMGQVLKIGKRRFRVDWRRNMRLFDRLVWTVISYRVKVGKKKKVWRGWKRYTREGYWIWME